MSRVTPTSLTLAPGALPKARLDAGAIRGRLTAAGIDETQHVAILAGLQSAMDAYCLDRLVEQHGATPAEVRAYLKALRQCLEQMRSLIAMPGAAPNRTAKALVTRAYSKGLLPVGFANDLDGILARLATAVSRAAAPDDAEAAAKTASGKTAQAQRHRKLAAGIMETFGANDWPIDLKPNGLMLQMFTLCLASVGEKQERPARVFDAAAQEMIAGRAVH